jgi:arylsulfatase A-like enzyme/Flp pilus assembly protein TadD
VVALVLAWQLRPARPNLLLITIDTLRADHLGAYGDADASTPVLDALAGRGARFDKAETAVPLTGPSHSTILTGLYPPEHGVRDNVTFLLDPSKKTLASHLRGAGYRTAAFVGAYPVAGALGFSQGFNSFEEGFHEIPVPGEGAQRHANEVADSVVQYLSQAQPPFFVWMHVYDAHAPYRPPPPYSESFKSHPYDGAIAFIDSQVGRVLEALKAAGRDKDTLVMVLGDHGEGLGEHGEANHAVLVYESTLRIPLLMAGPGVPRGAVVGERVGTVDVLPTILDLLGVAPPRNLRGRDLRPLLKGATLGPTGYYGESLFGRLNCRWSSLRTWTEGDWKLIEGAAPELFDLGTDPHETTNRAAQEPERVKKMSASLRAALARLAPAGDQGRPQAVGPDQLERLRSLGYTGGGTGGAGGLDEPGLPDPRERIHLYEQLQTLFGAPAEMSAQAADAAEKLAAQDPQNPFAYFVLGTLAYHAGEFPRAEGALARCLELDPDHPTTRAYHAQLLRDMGRLADSERELRLAVAQTTPDDLRTRISLAETLTLERQFDDAGRLLEGVLSQAPHHIEALGAKGRLLLAQGRGTEAIDYLRQACRENTLDEWIELASAEIAVGDPGGAADAAGRALSLNPRHPWAMTLLGHALILRGEKARGVELLEQALRAPPRRPKVWQSLSRAFAAAGDTAQAARCARMAEAPA